MNSSISRRLILWLAIPLTLLALCGALVHYFNDVAPVVIGSDRRLKDAAATLAARIESRAAPALPAPAGAMPLPDGVVFAVHDAAGALREGDPRLPLMPLPGDATLRVDTVTVDHRPVRALTQRVAGAAGPRLITVADMSPGSMPAARYGFMSTLLWDFVQLDVTLVLVWVGIRLGLRPVQRLREAIGSRSPQDLRPLDGSYVPGELQSVVVTLNRLFTTLKASADSQQQFIANTAHQLRTPLTGLQAQLDLLLAEPKAEPVRQRLATLQEGIRQLSHSANQLLALARADPAANITGKAVSIALDALAGDVVARFFDRALAARIDLGVDAAKAPIAADPALIDDLLSNLVDNALKYTPSGGSVTVSTGQAAGRSWLAVEDTGSGIPVAERDRVRQRFYRLPNSPGHGSGLGLAIVDEIARLYGAELDIGAGADGRGTRVAVHFPGVRML